jgi:hypothetical protein
MHIIRDEDLIPPLRMGLKERGTITKEAAGGGLFFYALSDLGCRGVGKPLNVRTCYGRTDQTQFSTS